MPVSSSDQHTTVTNHPWPALHVLPRVAKAGGCDHMHCICGCHFSWRAARPVSRPQMLAERAAKTKGALVATSAYLYFCVRLR
eukprot:2646437-Prymnesium_polylepis.1